MKTSLKFLGALALVIGFVSSVRAADLSGKWASQFESQMGQQKYTFELKVEGEKVTGKATREAQDQKTETEIKNGKLVKDEVSFTETLKIQDQEIAIEYKGKLVGDELRLHRKVGEFAEYDIVAKRVTEKK